MPGKSNAKNTKDKLSALMEMAALVNSSHEKTVIMNHAVKSICRLTNAEAGSLLLVDEQTGQLDFEVVLGSQSEKLICFRVPEGQGIAGWVAQNDTPLIVPDVQSDERFYRYCDQEIKFVTREMIAVPLRVNGSVIGVIQAINKKEGTFDLEDLELAMAFSNQIAMVVNKFGCRIFEIHTLGRFELLINGVQAGKPDAALASKPLQLLKAVIALGGSDVPQEQLADLLWPDADGDQARRSFDTTMHRLRKMLGHEQVLSIRNGKLNLDPALVWLDARVFESYFDRLSPVAKVCICSEQVPLYEKAIALYKGSFMPAEKAESWILDRRDRLRGRFVRLVVALGSFWEQHQKYEQALECYRHSLEVDTPSEELYRQLMSCLMTLDRHAEALAVFELCRRNLRATLGVEPSPATLALANVIRTAHN